MSTQELKWWHDATCQYVGPEFFFTDGKGAGKHNNALALRICARCPVVSECLEDAMLMERGEGRANRFGVRGGLTAHGRYQLAKHRGEPMRDNNGNLTEDAA